MLHDISFSRVLTVRDSSAIEEIAWDPKTKRLRVYFASTATLWEYTGVYPSDFAALACAHSVGLVFNERIRLQYPATRVFGPAQEESRHASKES